ncbi:ABC transporter ATP-binding protein [Peribacillus saganii]|uniref:ABC transporter ATP-binding protein n=1 Tax=Peribacillus saganii TaxID=2303992 RepID=A0A372LPB6_9BACI|nr:ABC transporter ATP-binding protein [Peribacillus saganii]
MSVLTISSLTIKHREETLVQNIRLSVNEGDWLALVGESGSGKSVTASSIGGLLPRELIISSGRIHFGEANLLDLKEKEWQNYRGKVISYIFQDYQGAFTPFMTIGAHFDEMLKTHTNNSKQQRKERALETLKNVNLPEERVYKSYPFQLSGGQLQRAAIAMAMMLKPKLLIADEPTTALDSITATHVLQLISNLQQQTNCAVLFITHDLRHVRKYANKMAVMLKGEIVESGSKTSILQQPQHAYTKALIAAIPSLRSTKNRLVTI